MDFFKNQKKIQDYVDMYRTWLSDSLSVLVFPPTRLRGEPDSGFPGNNRGLESPSELSSDSLSDPERLEMLPGQRGNSILHELQLDMHSTI